MKRFRERNRAVTGVVGTVVVLALIAGALKFSSLPLIHSSSSYSADFVNAGGLVAGDIVTVDGVKVGAITAMVLDGDQVRVTFSVQSGLHLGSRTSAAAKVLSPVGTEYMELTTAGPGSLSAVIPQARTSVPYSLVNDLSGLAATIQHYNIPQLERALDVGSEDLNATSVTETTQAFDGLSRISDVLGSEQTALATIVSQGAGLTSTLSQRSQQLFDLFGRGNLVLTVLEQRRSDIQQLLVSTAALSQQITSILSVNRGALSSLLNSLDTVSAILARDSNDLGQAIPVLAAFSRYSANTTGSGPFADVSVPTLLIPDNVAVQCAVSGAFPSKNPVVGCRP